MDGITTFASSPTSNEVLTRIEDLERDNKDLKSLLKQLNDLYLNSQSRIAALEERLCFNKVIEEKHVNDENDIDLFGSDSEGETEEAARIREERLAAYANKKSKKPAIIAKSSLVLDVKPWDDETDMNAMESNIRKISTDGLLWGVSKFVPVAFGIQKLSIGCVVEDEKISIDWLTEEIEKLEDFVQSVDVAAFNKI